MAANSVNIPITATNNTQRAFSQVQKSLAKMSNQARGVVNSFGKVGAAAAGVAVGALAALTKESMKLIDANAKMADRLGVTTEALTGFQHAANLSGVDANTFNKSLQNMGVQISNAAKGTGIAKDSLTQMGLSAAKLVELPLDQQMLAVADALQNVGTHTDKVRIATELFGARGAGLLVMLQGGSGGLRDMAAEAEKLGISMNRIDSAMVEKANDDIARAQSVFTGLGNQLATSFAPIIQGVATSFYQAALDSAEFGRTGQRAALFVVKAVGQVGNALAGLKAAWAGVKLVVADYYAWLFATMAEGARKLDGVIQAYVNGYNTIANLFGGDPIQFNPAGTLDDMSAAFRATAEGFRAELDAIVNAPLPSDAIMQWYEDVQAKARETAEIVAATAPGTVMAQGSDEAAGELKSSFDLADKAVQGASSTILSTAKTQMDTLKGIFAEGSGAAKAFYLISQGMAAAMAIVQGFATGAAIRLAYAELAAATANPALVGVGEMHAKFAEGMGFVSAAAIAGQTMASFEGGGYTGNGIRAGGLDGKGGYMAMVHPQESIIDHTKGQGAAPVNVSLNINAVDARGVDQLLMERRGMITSMVSQALANKGRVLGR